jgi:hypothetical protein
LLVSIAAINAWNRLNVATHQIAGSRHPSPHASAAQTAALML